MFRTHCIHGVHKRIYVLVDRGPVIILMTELIGRSPRGSIIGDGVGGGGG